MHISVFTANKQYFLSLTMTPSHSILKKNISCKNTGLDEIRRKNLQKVLTHFFNVNYCEGKQLKLQTSYVINKHVATILISTVTK